MFVFLCVSFKKVHETEDTGGRSKSKQQQLVLSWCSGSLWMSLQCWATVRYTQNFALFSLQRLLEGIRAELEGADSAPPPAESLTQERSFTVGCQACKRISFVLNDLEVNQEGEGEKKSTDAFCSWTPVCCSLFFLLCARIQRRNEACLGCRVVTG